MSADTANMILPIRLAKAPQPQQQSKWLEAPKPDPHSARNLLLGAHRKGWEAPPTAASLQTA